MTLVEYKEVTVSCPNRSLLENINISWSAGSFVYLIGQVGTGKSILLKTMYADYPLSSGEASVAGFSLNRLMNKDIPYLRRKLGVVVQNYRLFDNQTVAANLSFCLQSIELKDWTEIIKRVTEVLEFVGMQGSEDKFPYELSEGEKQKIAIARAIMNKPSVIIIDEPTGNLDVQSIKAIMQMLHKYANENNSLVVMATHNLQVVREFPGEVYLINDKTMTNVTERFYSKSNLRK